VEVNKREKRSLALYNELKGSWEREKYRKEKVLDGGGWASGG
jgi:hypothetical protein